VIPDEDAIPAAALGPAREINQQTRITVLAHIG
jgi:hypothetical protein